MEETNKYKVLDDVAIEGVEYNVDDVVELAPDVAEPFIADGKLEVASEDEDDAVDEE